MKTIIVSLGLLMVTSFLAYDQSLKDFYKKEVIQLQPVNDFAKEVDWQTLFPDYAKAAHGKNLGQMKKIVVAPDGSIFMSHKTDKYEIWKFDNNGKLVKKIGSKGSGPGQFIYEPGVEGILDGKYIITSEVNGRINFFDLEGNFVKILKLDYMPLSIVPLKGGKLAIMGGVAWKDEKWRNILRIKDFNSGEEKEIWQEITDPSINSIRVSYPDGGMAGFSLPYTHPMLTRFRIASGINGTLIVASPVTGEIKEYSADGKVLNSFHLNINPVNITDQDILDQYEQVVKTAEEFEKAIMSNTRWTNDQKKEIVDSYKSQLTKFKERENYPSHLPYFSSMVIDSDGNLVVFEFSKDENNTRNTFTAYSYEMTGQLLGRSGFKSDNYQLNYTPAGFQFYNGYVYTVAVENSELKGPPRLLKMKLL